MHEQFHRVFTILVPEIILVPTPHGHGIRIIAIAFIFSLTDASHMLSSIGITDIIEVVVHFGMEHEVAWVITMEIDLLIYDGFKAL